MVLAAWVVVWGGAFAQEVQVISSTPQPGTVPGTETAQPVKIPGQVITVEPSEGQVQLPADGEATAHLTTRTRRVAVDVVVTGEKGKPVAGLTANDFTVFEDGVPQPVKSFDPHTPATPVAYTPPPIPKLPPNTFLNLETAPAAGTPTVLLYDVLNTPRDAQGYAHEQMVSFIKHRKPGTQIAIFTLGDKLRLLQGFTEDSEALANALDRSNGHVAQSTQLERAGTTGTASTSLAPDPSTLQDPRAFNNPNVTQTVNALTSAEALEQSYMLDQRIDLTLDGLSEIGRFLAGLPGRKNLVWLSASFPSGVLPDGNIAVNSLTQDQSTRNYGEQMRQTTDLLNLSHVAVYPVDVRGLVVPGDYSAAAAKGQGPGSTGSSQQVATYVQDQALDHSTMDSIADSTGGKAFYSTNDLKGAVDRAMENGSTYYSLTYAPTNTRLDGSARKIKVKLDKPGYTLAYRTTYFADDLQRVAEEMADGPQSPLSPSLEHGAPVAHEALPRGAPAGDWRAAAGHGKANRDAGSVRIGDRKEEAQEDDATGGGHDDAELSDHVRASAAAVGDATGSGRRAQGLH